MVKCNNNPFPLLLSTLLHSFLLCGLIQLPPLNFIPSEQSLPVIFEETEMAHQAQDNTKHPSAKKDKSYQLKKKVNIPSCLHIEEAQYSPKARKKNLVRSFAEAATGAHTFMPSPQYPERCRAEEVTGKLLFQLSLNEKGHVHHVACMTQEEHPLLQEAGKKALSQWRLSPYYRAYNVIVPVTFSFDEET